MRRVSSPLLCLVAVLNSLGPLVASFAAAQIYRDGTIRDNSVRDEKDRVDATMRAQQSQAKAQMEAARLKVHKTFEASPEWMTAQADVKRAQDAYDAASKPVLDALRANPEYQQAVEAERSAKATVAAHRQDQPGATPEQMAPRAEQALAAASAVTTMEREALASDSNASTAKAKLDDATARLNALQAQRDAAVLADPDWQNAKKQLDGAAATAAQSR
jgi:hypothetical protein